MTDEDAYVFIHPNLVQPIGRKAKVANTLSLSVPGSGAAGMPSQKPTIIPENDRTVKMKHDFHSKINCLPNSMTVQLDFDKKRSKSFVNLQNNGSCYSPVNMNVKLNNKNMMSDQKPDLSFKVFDGNKTTTKGRRRMFKNQNYTIFEKSENFRG